MSASTDWLIMQDDGEMAVIADSADHARELIASEYGMDVADITVEQRWLRRKDRDGEEWWVPCDPEVRGARAWWVEVV